MYQTQTIQIIQIHTNNGTTTTGSGYILAWISAVLAYLIMWGIWLLNLYGKIILNYKKQFLLVKKEIIKYNLTYSNNIFK